MKPLKDHPIMAGIVAVASLGALLPNLDRIVRFYQSHETAWAAKAEVEKVDEKFEQYLQEQREFRAELRGYTKAMQERPEPVEIKPWVSIGKHGERSCCYEPELEDCGKRDWMPCGNE